MRGTGGTSLQEVADPGLVERDKDSGKNAPRPIVGSGELYAALKTQHLLDSSTRLVFPARNIEDRISRSVTSRRSGGRGFLG